MSFIPGMFPDVGSEARVSSLSVVATATVGFASSPNGITVPTVQAGDLIVQYVVASNPGNSPGAAHPPGWDVIGQDPPPGTPPSWGRMALWSSKKCDGSESGTTINTVGSNWNTCMRMLVVVRGDRPIATAALGEFDVSFSNGGNPSSQSFDPTAANAPVILFGTYTAMGGNVDPRTFTIGGVGAKDGEFTIASGTGVDQHWVAYKSFNRGGVPLAVTDIDMTNESIFEHFLAGFWFACT